MDVWDKMQIEELKKMRKAILEWRQKSDEEKEKEREGFWKRFGFKEDERMISVQLEKDLRDLTQVVYLCIDEKEKLKQYVELMYSWAKGKEMKEILYIIFDQMEKIDQEN